MNTILFMPTHILLNGFIIGIVFGFLLRKGYVTNFQTIVNQFLFRDFTVMNIILTATLFGGISLYAITSYLPEYTLLISKTTFFGAAIGGGIFGIGMAIMGYCPGTGIGALASGARDMWFGILGMIVGAASYAQLYPWIETSIKPACDMNRSALPDLLGISPWIFMAAIAGMLSAIKWYEQKFLTR